MYVWIFSAHADKLIDEQYTLDYLNPALHDAIIFRNFFDDLSSSDFRNRQVWQAWYYIHPLIVKYMESNDQIIHLITAALHLDNILFLTMARRQSQS